MGSGKHSGYSIRARNGHVEVTGVESEDVRRALDLLVVIRKSSGRERDVYVSKEIPGAGIVVIRRPGAIDRAAGRRRALLETPVFTYGDLAYARGVRSATVRSWVHRNGDKVLVIPIGARVVLPAFQFNDFGELDRGVGEVNAVLKRDSEMDEWSRWAWWHATTSFLSGQAPIDVVDSDLHRVVTAARRTVGRNAA